MIKSKLLGITAIIFAIIGAVFIVLAFFDIHLYLFNTIGMGSLGIALVFKTLMDRNEFNYIPRRMKSSEKKIILVEFIVGLLFIILSIVFVIIGLCTGSII